ncbi:hypothetical protein [Streptomyces lavendulae]|uniref:hypothetical protein n=1 Tax=Streptomyces lavendulae TaxID=1914 RepID=UPI002557A6BB|nr:hypothetical protein [Streptomyces lavendulae]
MSREATTQTGDELQITGGPFAGCTGTVRAFNPIRGRVQLTVDIFGDANTVDIPLSDVVSAA